MKRTLFLVRHGESLANIGADSGPNTGLSPRGVAQVRLCAASLCARCDARTILAASPFERTVCTAEAIGEATGLPIRLELGLMEYFGESFFPDLSNLLMPTLRQVARQHELVAGNYTDHRWWPMSYETVRSAMRRFRDVRDRVLGPSYDARTVILVGHWASVEGIVRTFLPDVRVDRVPNASVTRIDIDGPQFDIPELFDVSFLDGV